MAEQLYLDKNLSKKEKYETLFPQLEALLEGEKDMIANAANIVAALKEAFGFFWVGFYFVKNGVKGDELVLGPFQGPIACTRIGLGKGVCGTAWQKAETIVVDDVDQFPGHIACSSLSKSEIVIPVKRNNSVIGVLDVDSDKLADFTMEDAKGLEKVVSLFSNSF